MEKINIVGQIFDSSGYSIHTRQLASALHEEGCEVSLQIPLPVGWERLVTDSELLMIQRGFQKDGTTIAITTPPNWRMPLADNPKHFIGFCVWEGDKVPDYWMKYLMDERMNKIFVPSQHTKEAINLTLTQEYKDSHDSSIQKKLFLRTVNKINIIPHGHDPTIFKPKEEFFKGDKFTFIANKGWPKGIYDRGGIQWLVKAYMEEFTKEDKVVLNIKINPAYNPPGWSMKQKLIDIGITKHDKSPALKFNADLIDFKHLYKFYHGGDVFVAPTMGEAFGLPMIEAMACGIPVITTNFGGQIDFVSITNGWLVDYELGHHSSEIAYEEVKWAKPSIEELRTKMRDVYDDWLDGSKLLKMKSERAIETARKFTWRDSAKKVIKIIEGLE